MEIPTAYKVKLAGVFLDTAGTRTLNPKDLVSPAPKKRSNIWLPGYGWLARPSVPDARAVDLEVFVDGFYTAAGVASTAPGETAEATIAWLRSTFFDAVETGDRVAYEVSLIPSRGTVSGYCQIDDMVENGPDGPQQTVTFGMVLLG